MARWIATMISLAVMVGGGIAAAGTGDDPVLDEPVTTTTLVTTTTVTAPDAADDEAGDDLADGVERYWGPECGEGEPTNHGQYVASSDRDGESRSTAAQSPCGKPIQTVDVTTTTAAPIEDDEDDDATFAPQGVGSAGHGQGGGNGNAKGGNKHG